MPLKRILVLSIFSFIIAIHSQEIALLKYRGGGGGMPTRPHCPILLNFCNKNLSTNINPLPATIDVGSKDIFNYPFTHDRHGNVVFGRRMP